MPFVASGALRLTVVAFTVTLLVGVPIPPVVPVASEIVGLASVPVLMPKALEKMLPEPSAVSVICPLLALTLPSIFIDAFEPG